MSLTHDGLNQVFISIRSNLMRAVSRLVPPKEIEDIVQETYVRVCQIEKKEKILHPRSFMLKTAKNLALDHLKRAETRLADSIHEDHEEELTQCWSSNDETFHKVASDRDFALFCEAVRCLPPQCRKPFVMKKVYGYSQREIAERLQLSESTVEKHIAKGIRRCAEILAAQSATVESASTLTKQS